MTVRVDGCLGSDRCLGVRRENVFRDLTICGGGILWLCAQGDADYRRLRA